ncbi:hypothetical protein [Ralstonia phage RP13]|nr:hypothetical protein [Ralstonia phage RP13]
MTFPVIEFEGVQVQITPGSSGLLAKGVLPVGTSAGVPKLSERVQKGDNELVNKFIDTFGEFQVKAGVLDNLPKSIAKLLGQAPVRAPRAPSAPQPNTQPTAINEAVRVAPVIPAAPAFTAPEIQPFVYEAHGVPQADIDKFAAHMREFSSYSQQLGTSGHGKGTRLSLLMEFFKYLGFKFRIQTIQILKENRGTPKGYAGVFCDDLNMFILGKWVQSNISKLYSWSSMDTFTGPGNYWTDVWLVQQLKDKHFLQEGYVASFGPQLWAKALTEYGYDVIQKVGYEYETKEQMLARVVERQGRECKGDAAWSQNHLARQVITEDQKFKDENPGTNEYIFLSMQRFDVDVNFYGVHYLQSHGAPQSIIDEFIKFADKYSTKRHYLAESDNFNRFAYTYQEQVKEFNAATTFDYVHDDMKKQ